MWWSSGNSTGRAARPTSPLTPPVTPARNEENQVAGVGGGSSSRVSMATSRAFMIAERTMALSWLLAIFGRKPSTRLTGTAGIVGKPGGEIGIFEALYRLRQRRVIDL